MSAGPSMRVLDARATAAALPFERLIPALRHRFALGAEVPPRQVLTLPVPGGEPITSLVMPAWVAGEHYGVKTINIAPANAARGLPGLHASYQLFDAVTGVPLAVLDGGELTCRRTAAASALAADFLARADASQLLVVGAGAVARVLPLAYAAVRPLRHVRVWARRPAQAAALAAACAPELHALGIEVAAVSDLASAARAADIVSCATLATEPVLQGAWLAPGSHLDLIGSFTPAMREADDAAFHGAGLWVDTPEALAKSGELLGPMARGVFRAEDLRGTLAGLCRGEAAGRGTRAERTVFKSVGTALEDLAAAVLAVAGPRLT